MRLPVDETGETDAAVPDRTRTRRLQVHLPQVRGGRRFAAAHPLEVGAMRWIDDLKASASAFKEWARLLTIIGVVMAVSLVIIAIELLVICIKL